MKYYLSAFALLFVGCAQHGSYEQATYDTQSEMLQQQEEVNKEPIKPFDPKLECPKQPVVKYTSQATSPEHVACQPILQDKLLISVVGQGVAPANTASPAQAYALAKRAAIADAYRLIAEKVKGVRVDGTDLIQDMMVKRSTVRTAVSAMIKNATIVETNYKEGLCEVTIEITLSRSQLKL